MKLCDEMDHSPSLSISNTLMASCVLSGRTSLAGSVCLLWLPGETDGDDCIGLMKGCAPTTDIIRFFLRALFSPKKFLLLLLLLLLLLPFSSALLLRQDHLCQAPARTTGWSVSVFIGQLYRLWFTSWFAFEYLMSVNEWRSQLCRAIKIKPFN